MDPRALYYQDSHKITFEARVLTCTEEKGRYLVTLDNTAFYPEGGGQPADQGILDGVNVLDVQEQDGAILHTCDGPLQPEQVVEGRIHWERRFDFMQQHSGEHILSGLIHAAYGFHNVGFHMGADTVTIDFDGMIPQEDIPALEAKVNEAIWKNFPVKTWFATEEELSRLPYRSKKQLSGVVRLVEFPGYDLCACCGTHVDNTGEIGLLKILSRVKFHQGVRIEMVCGGMALRYLSQVLEQNRMVCQTFSAKPLETGAAAKKAQEDIETLKYRVGALENQIFDTIAQAHQGAHNLVLFEDSISPDGLRRLADKLGAATTGFCFVLSGNDEEGYRFAANSKDQDLRSLAKEMNRTLHARGGGKPEFIQGSIPATKDAIEAFLASLSAM